MPILPLISVIIPIFNAEKFLDTCLRAVCSQTYGNLEIILVNDGSTDNTEKICNEWKNRDIRILYTTQDNLGQGEARNRGVMLSKGEYLTFIDADDWVAAEYIEKLYKELVSENADICKSALVMIDNSTGKKTGQINAEPVEKENPLSYDSPHVAGILYRKELFNKYNLEMPKVKYEDLSIYPLILLLSKRVAVVEESLYFYRVNIGTSTMDNTQFLIQYPSALSYLIDESIRLKIYEQNKRILFDICLMHLNSALARIGEGDYYEKLRESLVAFLDNRFPWWKKFYNAGSWLYDGHLFQDVRKEKRQPKVSVLIPVYDVENYLEDCLRSVVSQTLKDIEIICINDGSTDNSKEILERFQKNDGRIRIINKENSGYGHSMNIGLALAQGEYIGIVESDDFAEPDMFEKLYYTACVDGLDVVKSNFYSYEYKGTVVSEFVESLWGCTYNKIFKPEEDQRIFFASQTIWSAIYRRKFLSDNGIKFNETPGASFQDTAFTFKVWMMAEKVLLIRDAFLHYRIDNINSSVQSSKKIFCVCDEYQEIERYLLQYPEKEKTLFATMLAIKYRTYKWNYERIDAAYQYAFLLKFADEFKLAEQKELLQENAWRRDNWEELQVLLQSVDRFYLNTTRAVFEDKIAVLKSRNANISKEAIKKLSLSCDITYIIGCGDIGIQVYETLKECVRDQKDLLNFQEGKLFEADFCQDLIKNNSLLIIAVEEEWQFGLQKKAEQLGFENIVLCGDEWEHG